MTSFELNAQMQAGYLNGLAAAIDKAIMQDASETRWHSGHMCLSLSLPPSIESPLSISIAWYPLTLFESQFPFRPAY